MSISQIFLQIFIVIFAKAVRQKEAIIIHKVVISIIHKVVIMIHKVVIFIIHKVVIIIHKVLIIIINKKAAIRPSLESLKQLFQSKK